MEVPSYNSGVIKQPVKQPECEGLVQSIYQEALSTNSNGKGRF